MNQGNVPRLLGSSRALLDFITTVKRHQVGRGDNFLQLQSEWWVQQGVREEMDLTIPGISPGMSDEAKEGKEFELAGEAVIRMLEHRNK